MSHAGNWNNFPPTYLFIHIISNSTVVSLVYINTPTKYNLILMFPAFIRYIFIEPIL